MIPRRALLASPFLAAAQAQAQPGPTKFQLACMTLPYAAFPLERALSGIKASGYDFVAWGSTHTGSTGTKTPVLSVDAPPSDAAKLAARCRAMGLEPVMMFSTVNVESPTAVDAHLRRIDQAAAAKIPFLLTFGKTTRGEYGTFVENLKRMAPHAGKAGVLLVIKQHGGVQRWLTVVIN